VAFTGFRPRAAERVRKIVTEIVTDVLTWVPKLTILTLPGHVESATCVLSMPGECIRLTGLPAITYFVFIAFVPSGVNAV
jgi:hypothetical protein